MHVPFEEISTQYRLSLRHVVVLLRKCAKDGLVTLDIYTEDIDHTLFIAIVACMRRDSLIKYKVSRNTMVLDF